MARFLSAQDDKAQTMDEKKMIWEKGKRQPSEIRDVNIREAYVGAEPHSKDMYWTDNADAHLKQESSCLRSNYLQEHRKVF